MQEQYERAEFTVTSFDVEDVITTSGNPEDKIHVDPKPPVDDW